MKGAVRDKLTRMRREDKLTRMRLSRQLEQKLKNKFAKYGVKEARERFAFPRIRGLFDHNWRAYRGLSQAADQP